MVGNRLLILKRLTVKKCAIEGTKNFVCNLISLNRHKTNYESLQINQS